MTQPVRTAPTLAEVAAAAGVSRSTASRALNDSPRISEETKRRVRAAAKEVNFVPNAIILCKDFPAFNLGNQVVDKFETFAVRRLNRLFAG